MRPCRPLFPAGFPLAALLISICLASAAVGCGRKLPPIQPGVHPPPAVSDLAYEVSGSAILLSWSVPAARGEQEAPVAGFKILRYRQTADEKECPTCPQARFQVIGEVLAKGRGALSRLRFRDQLEPGFRHQYAVRAYSADGVEGKNSNVVVFSQ